MRKLDPFRKFLEVAAQSNAKIVNYTNIAEDVGVDPKTVQNYYQILKDTQIGFILEPFYTSLRKGVMKSPKFYFFDIGVTRAIARQLETRLTESTSLYGDIFEQFIILEAFRIINYHFKQPKFYYLKTHDSLEVDLIIDIPSKPKIIVEIKSATSLKEKHLKTLILSQDIFKGGLFYCVSRDKTEIFENNINCVYWENFLKFLHNLK